MSCIANNIIISVLTALYNNILGRQTAIVLPKMEISSNISWIANFLQSQHIRPERIYIPLASILQQLAESQTGIQQYILLFLLGQLVVMLREIIVTEYIIWHSLNIQAWLLIRYRNPLSQLHKVMAVHVFLYHLIALLGAGHRKQRLILVGGKNSIQILHNHCKAGVIMSLLLRQHQMQGLGWMHRHLALDRTNSTHINTPPIHTYRQ